MAQGQVAAHNTRTNITIPKDLKAQLEKVAKSENRSFNNLVITILKEHVKSLEGKDKE